MLKRILVATLAGAFILGMSGLASADLVSFVTPFFGSDTTSGWSLTDITADLSYSTFTILGGTGTVSGYLGLLSHDFSHRGTRGLGIRGGENDEVDYRPGRDQERIEIVFDDPVRLDYLELRSLFDPEGGDPEQASAYYYLLGSLVGSDTLLGSAPVGSGIGQEFTTPHLTLDKILLQVDTQTLYSDFALAKLGVNIPEPATMSLFGMGILGLLSLRRKRA